VYVCPARLVQRGSLCQHVPDLATLAASVKNVKYATTGSTSKNNVMPRLSTHSTEFVVLVNPAAVRT